MTDWAPIASAPRDGTRVLLWTDTRNPIDQDYVDDCLDGDHFSMAQIGHWELDVISPLRKERAHWEKPLIGEPTHWMPLPSPPEAT